MILRTVLCLLVFVSSLSYAQEKRPSFKFYGATNRTGGNNPVVVVCPGGGYRWLGRGVEGRDVARWLNANGLSAVVLYYRVSPNRYPAMLEDLQQTIRYVRRNAAKLDIDSNRVGVMGFSAGGHLAGLATVYGRQSFVGPTDGVSLEPNFAALIYPVVTMSEAYAHTGSRIHSIGADAPQAMQDSLSLEKHLRTDLPPMFIAHSRADHVVDYRNSTLLADSLSKKKAPYALLLYRDGTHGFGINRAKGKDAIEWSSQFIEWYRTTFPTR